MKHLLLIALAGFLSHKAQADIYKYTDANGIVTYTNVKPGKGRAAELVISTPAQPAAPTNTRPPSARQATPAQFPKVDSQLQNQRDSKRREILMTELEQEQQSLAQAQSLYEEAKNTPEVYRNAQGKTFRNVAKYDEKLRLLEAEMQAHARNIELLNKELNP